MRGEHPCCPRSCSERSERLYLGVDVGGTKVQASLVRESGEIIGRERRPTPRKGGPERVVAALEKAMDDIVQKGGISPDDLTAIGIAVPGVVDPDRGLVVVTPNMPLTGVALGSLLEARFKAPIVIGNDGNFGALGESWLGSARNARSAMYICVGTGIGSGLVQRGKLWRGDRESAGEIGHMIMQIGRPQVRLRQPRLLRGPGQPHRHRARHPRGHCRRPAQRAGGIGRRRSLRHSQRHDPQGPRRGRRTGHGHHARARPKCWATPASTSAT